MSARFVGEDEVFDFICELDAIVELQGEFVLQSTWWCKDFDFLYSVYLSYFEPILNVFFKFDNLLASEKLYQLNFCAQFREQFGNISPQTYMHRTNTLNFLLPLN